MNSKGLFEFHELDIINNIRWHAFLVAQARFVDSSQPEYMGFNYGLPPSLSTTPQQNANDEEEASDPPDDPARQFLVDLLGDDCDVEVEVPNDAFVQPTAAAVRVIQREIDTDETAADADKVDERNRDFIQEELKKLLPDIRFRKIMVRRSDCRRKDKRAR